MDGRIDRVHPREGKRVPTHIPGGGSRIPGEDSLSAEADRHEISIPEGQEAEVNKVRENARKTALKFLQAFVPIAKDAYQTGADVARRGILAMRLLGKLATTMDDGLSVVDDWHAGLNLRIQYPERRYGDKEFEVRVIQNSSPEFEDHHEVTLVFLPSDTSIDEAQGYGLIPKYGKAIVFTIPGGFVNCKSDIT